MSDRGGRVVLMNPGPVLVDERVRSALLGPDLCHREPEYAALMDRVRNKVTCVCGGGDSLAAVLLTGSGTAALEATLASVVPDGGTVLVLSNGHYGERLASIARAHQIPCVVIDAGWGAPLEVGRLAQELAAEPRISHVAMVHHETSTGMRNRLEEVADMTEAAGRSLIVDAVSSLGGEALDVEADRIDWCVGTANKCLEGLPGVSFVCGPSSGFEQIGAISPRSVYLDLGRHYRDQERGVPPFTPAVQTVAAFDIALDLMLAEGVHRRTARYFALSEQLRLGLEALGLRIMLSPEWRASSLTTVLLPEGMDYSDLHDQLKDRGFVIYAGQQSLQDRVFRLATMGQITEEDVAAFLGALANVLAASR